MLLKCFVMLFLHLSLGISFLFFFLIKCEVEFLLYFAWKSIFKFSNDFLFHFPSMTLTKYQRNLSCTCTYLAKDVIHWCVADFHTQVSTSCFISFVFSTKGFFAVSRLSYIFWVKWFSQILQKYFSGVLFAILFFFGPF